nr:unnamed protein product [Callosobruchus analis]
MTFPQVTKRLEPPLNLYLYLKSLSVDRIPTEIKNFKSTTKQLKEYYTAHPKFRSLAPGQSELGENYKVDTKPIGIRKYGSSSFRHKPTNNGGLLKDYIPSEVSEQVGGNMIFGIK